MTVSQPRWLPLWTAYLGFIATGLSNNVLGASWLLLQPTFGQSLSSVGTLIAAQMVGSLTSSLLSGFILARMPITTYCALGGALASLGLLGYLGSSWWLIVGLTFVIGLGAGMLGTGLNTFVAAHYPASRMNWLHASYGLGSSVGPFFFTLWVFRLGLPWRTTYMVIAGVYALLAVLVLLNRRYWPPLRFNTVKAVSSTGMRQALSLGVVWLGMALLFTHNGTSMSSGQLTSSLFTLGRGVPPEIAGNAAGIYWASVMLGRFLTGLIIDSVGSVRLLRVCTALTVLATLLLIAAPTPMLGFMALALMGLTLGPVYPTTVSRTPELVGGGLSAHAIGVQTAAASLGSAALPALLSGVADGQGAGLIAPGIALFALLQFAAHEALVRYSRRSQAATPVKV